MSFEDDLAAALRHPGPNQCKVTALAPLIAEHDAEWMGKWWDAFDDPEIETSALVRIMNDKLRSYDHANRGITHSTLGRCRAQACATIDHRTGERR